MKYDFLIVGAGLYGSTFAYEATKKGKRCLVIDRRSHIGGNVYTKDMAGIQVHQYGAHVFHTRHKAIWDFINQFSAFNNFINSPIANYKGEIYNLPFNMNTFNRLWHVVSPKEARAKLEAQTKPYQKDQPKNLEEQALHLVGPDIYHKLIKGYTEKQWGRDCTKLPAFIIRRIPLRLTYNNNYYNDPYQGIPVGGYTPIIEKMLEGAEVELGVDFFDQYRDYKKYASKLVFTGMIDAFYGYRFGALAYRSLRFEHEVLDCDNYQGVAVVNYTSLETPYTRIIEHKHFEFGTGDKTVITREYPMIWTRGDEPYYPINDKKNNRLFARYHALAEKDADILFGGRLGQYTYYDMDQVIQAARTDADNVMLSP